jgi:type I restriction enzyme S subunit
MELITKPGYKQTKSGMIPEDWTVKKFDEFGKFFKGKGIKKDEVKFEGNPCVRYGELYTKYDNVIKETFSFISNEIAEQSIKLKRGDLLFAGSGETKEGIGKSAVILRDDTYAGGDIVVFRAKNIDPIFLGFMSNSIPVSKQKAINGQGDTVVHIYAGGISKIQIPLPPTLEEQQAIATALSDVDDLIANLDKLISKKKAIKQGAMQQLLTPPNKGGKRLHGFSGEWEEKTLGEVCDITSGESPSKFNFTDGDVPFFKVEQLNNGNKFADITPYYITHSNTVKANSIVFPKRGASIFQNKIRLFKRDSFLDTNLMALTIFDKFNYSYLFYYITFNKLDNIADTTSIPQINNKHINPYIIYIPPIIEEQKAIAQILSDMDEEIEQLESKKAKHQQVKQGMMQELLTGKTRLV